MFGTGLFLVFSQEERGKGDSLLHLWCLLRSLNLLKWYFICSQNKWRRPQQNMKNISTHRQGWVKEQHILMRAQHMKRYKLILFIHRSKLRSFRLIKVLLKVTITASHRWHLQKIILLLDIHH